MRLARAGRLAVLLLWSAADLSSVQSPAGDTVRVGKTDADGTTSVVTMTMDDYVASVVAGEQHANSPAAALEALAITARTYALANRKRHARDGFDLCDLTHCQVLKASTPASRVAASATRGRVLLYGGRPASVFYTASCGGRTERGDAVWPRATFPFLPSQMDVGCERLPGWSSEITPEDLGRALRASGLRGRLENMRVVTRTPSGRAATVRIGGFVPPEIDGDALRAAVGRTLGWQHLKSTLFDVRRTDAGYRFTGRGSGHGVGLCMVGSIRWARQGLTTDDILHRYFPGLVIGIWPATSETPADTLADRIRIELPIANAGERRHLMTVIQSELEGLAGRLDVQPPTDLAVVFHPTLESYRRSTKPPWWMAVPATPGQRIDLPPIATLRAKGLLEQAVRHELVHVLTVDALRERPMWVREGVALYFAGEAVDMTAPATTCPPKSSVTVSAHRDLTRRDSLQAGTCVAKAFAAGVRWNEVR